MSDRRRKSSQGTQRGEDTVSDTMSKESSDQYWKGRALVERYLREVRSAVPDRERQIEVMLRLLGSLKRPVERFLDLGCGDGILSGALLEQYPSASGVLVDYSDPMIEAAEARFAGRDEKPKIIRADMADAAAMEALYDEGPFDAVISGFSIHHLTDLRKRELYSEILEWLRPGGMFINHEHVVSQTDWIERVFDGLMIDSIFEHRRASGDEVSREQVAEDYETREDKDANILAQVELQCAWLRDLGYRDVDCFFKLFEIATFGGRKPMG
jgi:SAM-dependent methyltransferase